MRPKLKIPAKLAVATLHRIIVLTDAEQQLIEVAQRLAPKYPRDGAAPRMLRLVRTEEAVRPTFLTSAGHNQPE